jgi:hypothetical protein
VWISHKLEGRAVSPTPTHKYQIYHFSLIGYLSSPSSLLLAEQSHNGPVPSHPSLLGQRSGVARSVEKMKMCLVRFKLMTSAMLRHILECCLYQLALQSIGWRSRVICHLCSDCGHHDKLTLKLLKTEPELKEKQGLRMENDHRI